MSTLRVHELGVRYAKSTILEGIDFAIEAGERVAILGPNGAGKSTLLRALAGLVPYSGTIEAGGRSLSSMDARERARTLAYVPQRSMLHAGLETGEVVAQGRYAHGRGLGRLSRKDEERVARAMEIARCLDLAGRRFDRLSIGQQQRILIARALATQAPILLMDEPTAALDVREVLATFRMLRELPDRTVLCVIHGLADARRFTDRALLLDAGTLVRFGPSAEVVAPMPVRDTYGVRMIEDADLRFEEGFEEEQE